MSLLKTNEIQNYNGSSLTLTASTVSTSAQLNTGGNVSVTGSLNVSDDSTTRTNLGLGTIATQDSDSITVTGGTATLGALTVSGSDSGDLVRITQTGTGNALVVEDSANPDSTPFVVDASGHVGIGTSSPSYNIDVKGSTGISAQRATDTDRLIMQFTGFTSYANSAGAYNNISFTHLNNSGSVERMRIDSSGNLLVGAQTSYTEYGLIQVRGDNQGIAIQDSTDNSYRAIYNQSGTLYFWNGSNEGYLSAAGAWTNSSDARLKTNVRDIEYGLNTILSSQPRHFERVDIDGTYIGFVAQELRQLVPEVVSGNPDKQLGVDYGSLVAIAFKAIQEQQTLIESQQSQIDALTTRIEALETT
jgi:hypothetical protein